MLPHAALLNAQAVINTERAWLTVVIADELAALPDTARNRVENERRQIRRVMAERISEEENGEGYMCYISIQNQGRTPAKIVGGSSAHCFIDRPDNLPIPPDYSTPFFLPDSTFIVTGDSFKIHPGFKPDFILERTGKRGAVDGALKFLIVFGCVVYEDVFALPDGTSGTHETRWCFAYRPSGDKPSLNSMFLSPTEQPRPAAFVTCGPPEYSGHKENKSQ